MKKNTRILRFRDLNTTDQDSLSEEKLLEVQVKQNKLGMSDVVLLLAVFACAFHFFNLTDLAWKHGVFNSRDIGLVIIGYWLIKLLLHGKLRIMITNGFSNLLMIFLFFMLIQASMASFSYGQSIVDGIIGARHQFYYLSFFVFLGLLDNQRKVHQALNTVAYLAVFLSLLGFINYFIVTIYQHQWAEGHGERAGVIRAYVAGIDIITLGLFWSALQWIYNKKTRIRYFLSGLIFLLMIVIVQTRGRLVGIFGASILLLIYKKNYKAILGSTISALFVLILVGALSEKNILVESFVSAYDEITQGNKGDDLGTWAARLQQLNVQVALFLEHPWIGSGTSALRIGTNSGMSDAEISYLSLISRNEDLGYTNWIKSYGIAGIIWLVTLYYLLGKYMKTSAIQHKGGNLEPVVYIASGYVLYVLISFVTLPHFMRPDLILLFCFILTILVKTYQIDEEVKKTESGKGDYDVL